MEEKIWDLHSFRKNLFIISIFNILITFFWAEKIKDVNFLFFKLDSLQNWKVFLVLLIANIYTLWRYWQYVQITPANINYKFLLKEIVNNKNINKSILSSWNSTNLYIDEKWNLIDNNGYILQRSIINNENIKINLSPLDSVNTSHSIRIIVDYDSYEIRFNLNDVSSNFFVNDKYYADVFIPYLLWFFWICLILFNLFYELWKQ